jgi:hypothetical protein
MSQSSYRKMKKNKCDYLGKCEARENHGGCKLHVGHQGDEDDEDIAAGGEELI